MYDKSISEMSPTLLGAMIQTHTISINNARKVVVALHSSIKIQVNSRSSIHEKNSRLCTTEFLFNDIPLEFRQAFIDYTTRLIEERSELEAAMKLACKREAAV
jgi:hypothetical protein